MLNLDSVLAASLADGFRKFAQGSYSFWDYLFLGTGLTILAAGAVALYFWDWKREKTVLQESTAEALFRDLCNEHRLTKTESDFLLKGLGAGPDRLEQPALVFVDANLLRDMPGEAEEEARTLRSLQRKLFGL